MPVQADKTASAKIGFIAFYKGKNIGYASDLKDLVSKARVQALLGNKDLIIKHTVPENLIAIYGYRLS
jgi:hypothetical protein